MAGSNSKKKRTKKVSQGIHGAKKHPLSELEKVLLGKGLYASWRPLQPKQEPKRERKHG